ncbi:g2563 [Coccomyxa elongata]
MRMQRELLADITNKIKPRAVTRRLNATPVIDNVTESRITMLAGRYMRALQCIDDIMMHAGDAAISEENKMPKIRESLLQFMRCVFDEKDPDCAKFREDAAAMLA